MGFTCFTRFSKVLIRETLPKLAQSLHLCLPLLSSSPPVFVLSFAIRRMSCQQYAESPRHHPYILHRTRRGAETRRASPCATRLPCLFNQGGGQHSPRLVCLCALAHRSMRRPDSRPTNQCILGLLAPHPSNPRMHRIGHRNWELLYPHHVADGIREWSVGDESKRWTGGRRADPRSRS